MSKATGMCSKCGGSHTGNHRSYCLICHAEYQKTKRSQDRQGYNEYQYEYSRQNPEKRLEYKRRWILKSQYGITLEDLESLLESQDHLCAICHREISYGGKQFDAAVIDHDHASGQVRGLLCGHCNKAIGLFGDNIQVLKSAIEYLSKEK